MSDVTNHNGKFILNGVERPTVPFEPYPAANAVIEAQSKKRNFVDLNITDDGAIGVYHPATPPILIGKMEEAAEAVYGDVLRQIIDSGVIPTVEATMELIGDYPSVWLHFRQNAEELAWGKFTRRPDPVTQARLDESAKVQLRAKEALKNSRPRGREMESRGLAISEYQSVQKKPVIVWLLWLFLGSFGVHRFYLGDTKQGVLMLIAGLCFWVPGLIWALIDAFSLNSRIQEVNHSTWSAIADKHDVAMDPLPEGTYK